MLTTWLVAWSLHIMTHLPAHILVFYSHMQLAYREMACQAPGPMQPLDNAQTSLWIWSQWTTCRLLTPASWVLGSCKSHHSNISIIHLVQNIFNKDPSHRTISLNATYIILFKNPRNKSHWDKQLYPSSNRILTPPTGLSRPYLPTATWPLTQTGDIRWVTRGTFHLHNNTLFPNEDFPEASAYCPTSKDWANTKAQAETMVLSFTSARLPWQQGSTTITTATYMLMTRTLAAGLTTTARHSSRMQPCSIAIPWLPAPRSDAGSVHAAWSLATFAGTWTPYASWPRRSPRWSGSW